MPDDDASLGDTNRIKPPDTAAATGSDEKATVAPLPLSLSSYEVGEVIGKGGMGEVLLAHDPTIGRNVAIKRLLAKEPSDDAVDRFLREAKIQGRLDHPAIVPVYELGHDAEGRPYFTMKRLAGTTLHDLLRRPGTSLRQLLRAFADVCLAIEFAHKRGVVHRDLKPANIMLGDYGEVYVLDWGIARVLHDHEGSAGASSKVSTLEGQTETGEMLGTLGYMAPEQVRGDADVGAAADVYSLGTILFEILVGESLHPHGHAAIASTLTHPEQAPAARAPHREIAPELDAACVAALGEEPATRPSARALGDRIQQYLDGDRDLERRRSLAAMHLASAHDVALDPESQAVALQIAGRALALDPESKEAARLITTLMLAPPRNGPPELEARLRAVDAHYTQRSARISMYAMLAMFAFLPLNLWSGFTSPIVGVCVFVLIVCIAALIYPYRSRGVGGRPLYAMVIGFALLAALLTRYMGPFIIVPGVLGIMAVGLLARPDLLQRPALVLGILVAAFLVPIALEELGVLTSTWSVTGDSIVLTSGAIRLHGASTTVMLIAGNVATIMGGGLISRELSTSRRQAQRSVEIQAWRLEQLVGVDAPRPQLVSGGFHAV